MQNENIENVYNQIVGLKMSELVELSNLLTKRLGLNVMGSLINTMQDNAQEEIKKQYKVFVEAIGDNKIESIKNVRLFKGLGLKESKDFVENVVGREEIFDEKEQAEELFDTYNKIGFKVSITEVA